MQLSQITPSPKVSDELIGAGHTTKPAYDGGGFQSVFAGNASAGDSEPNGSEPSDSARAASAERTGTGPKSSVSSADSQERDEETGNEETGKDESGKDEQPAGIAVAEVPMGALSQPVKQDGKLVPGFVRGTTAPGRANAVQAPAGPTRGQMQPAVSLEASEGDIVIASNANAKVAADPANVVASGSASNPVAPGAEKPGQSATPSAGEVAGNTSRGSVLPAELLTAMADQDTGRSVLATGMAGQTAAGSRDGQVRLDGVPGGSEGTRADLAASTVEIRAEGEAGTAAVLGQSTDGAISLPEGRKLPRDGRETPAEARTTIDTTAPAAQGESKAQTAMMVGAAPIAGAVAAGADVGATMRGAGPGGTREIDGLLSADPAMTDPFLGDARGPLRTATPSTFSVLQSPDTPRQVALQIAEVVRASGDRAVELKLQPEELGRVHLTMSQDATGTLTVSLNAERADTLDLLRRNIDLLGADLQDLGYESIDFSFHGDGAGTGAEQDAQSGWNGGASGREIGARNTDGPPPPADPRGAQTSGDSIDIRI